MSKLGVSEACFFLCFLLLFLTALFYSSLEKQVKVKEEAITTENNTIKAGHSKIKM